MDFFVPVEKVSVIVFLAQLLALISMYNRYNVVRFLYQAVLVFFYLIPILTCSFQEIRSDGVFTRSCIVTTSTESGFTLLLKI